MPAATPTVCGSTCTTGTAMPPGRSGDSRPVSRRATPASCSTLMQRSSTVATMASPSPWKSASRPVTISRFDGSASSTQATARAGCRSRAMARWCWGHSSTTNGIRPSAKCSSAANSCPASTPCCSPADRAVRAISRRYCCIASWLTIRTRRTSTSRPIALSFSVEVAASACRAALAAGSRRRPAGPSTRSCHCSSPSSWHHSSIRKLRS